MSEETQLDFNGQKFGVDFSKIILDALARLERAHELPILPLAHSHVILSDGTLVVAPHEAIKEIKRRDPTAKVMHRQFVKREQRVFKILWRLTVKKEE